jgi:hypothetical protein
MVVKAKQTTALKYCKYEQIKATMVKRTRQNRSIPDWPAYTASANTGLLFISPPKRSDFYAVSRTGLLWCSVNSSRIRYENRDSDGGGVSPPPGLRTRMASHTCGSLHLGSYGITVFFKIHIPTNLLLNPFKPLRQSFILQLIQILYTMSIVKKDLNTFRRF